MIELKAYTGLIRNHRELADELGVEISGLARAEREKKLIVAAWQEWGCDMGSHLNGQFALALYDAETGKLFCARDPFGAELLFYYQTAEGNLLYSTDIKGLFGQPGFVRELNEDMIPFFLEFTYVPGEDTLFKGVRKLEPGGYLTYSAADGLNLGRYWELEFNIDESKTVDEWADAISDAMDGAMRDIMDEGEVADSFLSGGVDSSFILAKGPAKCGYCVAYEDQKASEEDDARATAAYLGREFEAVKVTPDDFFGNIDEFLTAYEQPSADVAGLSLYCGCKKVAEKSTLCFSGEGADEFFAGYGVYGLAKKYKSQNAVYFGSTHIMDDAELRRYLADYRPSVTSREFMRDRGAAGRRYDTVTWMLYVEMRSYFEGSILFNSTKISRGTGLDIRMPFVDRRMLDVALSMPSRFKRDGENNKVALRKAASRVLPHEVAYRKKLGFPVPISSWLRTAEVSADIERAFASETAAKFFDTKEIGALLDAFLGRKPRVSHPIWFATRKALLWRHVWTIYLFIRWYDLFFGEKAEQL